MAATSASRMAAEAYERQHGRRPTLPEIGIAPSTRTGSRPVADWDNATAQFPSIKAPIEDWIAFFDLYPEVMHAILGDIYIATVYDERKRDTGKRLDGRRVMPKNANLADLHKMTTPQYSMQPFGLAIAELKGERSLRQFAGRVPMDHRELSRMMRGQATPSMYWMERIAGSWKVHPAYFMEWRIAFITGKLTAVFAARPNLTVGVFKRMVSAPQLR